MLRLPHPRTALSGYADARLPSWRRAVVRHHLRGCTRCAVEVGQIRALRQVLRTPPPVPGPPDALVDRLLALDSSHRVPVPVPLPVPGPTGPRRERAGVGAAGVLVAAVVMVGAVGAGAVVTGVPVPWPSVTARASVSGVLPRLWPAPAPASDPSGAAVPARGADNGLRP